ncbi:MAG: DUF1444 family protein [Candidatus Obscuribacter phosphatis]|uniref:DUF1444 family protein n=1 Tax=Candidatus Obscuribacter phosphatis TaxID=1906157 RepID=A0A8J7PCR1_9BACT|nr:DUF1444 family protein [Candidatus Obscuribacter phosphatis]
MSFLKTLVGWLTGKKAEEPADFTVVFKVTAHKLKMPIGMQSAPLTNSGEDETLDAFWSDEVESAKLKQKRFTELMAEALQKRDPENTYVCSDKFYITVTTKDGQNGSIFSENIWREVADCPGERKPKLRTTLAMGAMTKEYSLKENLDRIIPTSRGKDYIDYCTNQMEDKIFYEELTNDLYLSFVLDLPDLFLSVSKQDIDECGKSLVELKEIAKDNLRRCLPEAIDVYSRDRRLYVMAAGGNYEAYTIHLPECMQQIRTTLERDFAFAIPGRDLFLFCKADDGEALLALQEQAKLLFKNHSRPISPGLFVFEDGELKGIEISAN